MYDRESVIARATAAVEAATPQAVADPTRPAYHFCCPAHWMNDPNGPIYHHDAYHVFYQHYPFGDTHGPMYWGHTRTRDLVTWEHLPIALWPSNELGETDCFSGCGLINELGQPIFFYTKVDRSENGNRTNEQWAAIGSDDLLTWEKHPANPILHLERHGGPKFADDWRDPFIFHEAGRTFMIVGACWEHGTPIYEAEDAGLTQWTYRGIMSDIATECPNFVKLGNKWLYLSSPFRPVEYFVGDFDIETLKFEVESRGLLDPGAQRAGFYASNLVHDDQGRCILLGWVRGFEPGRGWNGCFALPRVLTLGDDGLPRQTPVPELAKLRTEHRQLTDLHVENGAKVLPEVRGNTLELLVTLEAGSARNYGLQVCCAPRGEGGIAIDYDGDYMTVNGTSFPFQLRPGESVLNLHVFLDRSVLEVYVNGGRAVATHVIYSDQHDLGVAVYADGGDMRVRAMDAWTLKSIWS